MRHNITPSESDPAQKRQPANAQNQARHQSGCSRHGAMHEYASISGVCDLDQVLCARLRTLACNLSETSLVRCSSVAEAPLPENLSSESPDPACPPPPRERRFVCAATGCNTQHTQFLERSVRSVGRRAGSPTLTSTSRPSFSVSSLSWCTR